MWGREWACVRREERTERVPALLRQPGWSTPPLAAPFPLKGHTDCSDSWLLWFEILCEDFTPWWQHRAYRTVCLPWLEIPTVTLCLPILWCVSTSQPQEPVFLWHVLWWKPSVRVLDSSVTELHIPFFFSGLVICPNLHLVDGKYRVKLITYEIM